MTRPPIFNDYDNNGFRTNITGSRSHKTTDENIVTNLRFRWPKETANVNDQTLLNAYDEFAMDPSFGNNDENFLTFLSDYVED